MADYYYEEWKRLPSAKSVGGEIKDQLLERGLEGEFRFGFDPKYVASRPIKSIAKWLLAIMDTHEFADSYVCTLIDSCLWDVCQDKKVKNFNENQLDELIELIKENKGLSQYYGGS